MTTYAKCLSFMILFVCATGHLVQAQTPEDTIKYHYPPVTTIGTRYAEPWIQVPLSLSYIQQRAAQYRFQEDYLERLRQQQIRIRNDRDHDYDRDPIIMEN